VLHVLSSALSLLFSPGSPSRYVTLLGIPCYAIYPTTIFLRYYHWYLSSPAGASTVGAYFSYIFYTAVASLYILAAVRYGLGKHSDEINRPDMEQGVKVGTALYLVLLGTFY
jgi:hypothetical protein